MQTRSDGPEPLLTLPMSNHYLGHDICQVTFVQCNVFHTSVNCKSVRKQQPILPDTPVDRTGASKYLQTLPGPSGAKHTTFRLYNSILRCSWQHLQLWKCIQDAPSWIVIFWSGWNCCWGLRMTLRAAETSMLLYRRLCDRFLLQWFWAFRSDKVFRVSSSSLIQLQELLHSILLCNMYLTDTMQIHMFNLTAVSTQEHSEDLQTPIECMWQCTWMS
jgi:hypothetical protein